MNIGHAIKAGLLRKNMKQVDLARKIGRSPQQISDWIKGRKKPQVEDFIKLIIELGIDIESFNYETDIVVSQDEKKLDKISIIEDRLSKIEKTLIENGIVKIETKNGHVVNNVNGNVHIKELKKK